MSNAIPERVVIEGVLYLTLDAVSECYEIEVTWLREAYDVGLFGAGRTASGTVLLQATVLDRVAEVVRLGRYQGLSFETIVVMLGDPEDPGEGIRRR